MTMVNLANLSPTDNLEEHYCRYVDSMHAFHVIQIINLHVHKHFPLFCKGFSRHNNSDNTSYDISPCCICAANIIHNCCIYHIVTRICEATLYKEQ